MPTTITSPETHRRHHHRRHYLTRNQRKLFLFFLKCIIMLIIFSLFLFFLGFAAIVLFHFLIMSNTFNRRKPAAAADSPPSILLPDVIYKASDFETASDCAICLDSFVEGDTCRDLPTCGHFFHARCVDKWIGRRPTCPVCRTRVDLYPVGLTGSGGVDRWKGLWGNI